MARRVRWCATCSPARRPRQPACSPVTSSSALATTRSTSPAEAANAMRGAAAKIMRVALRMIRDGQPVFVGVNLDQSSEG